MKYRTVIELICEAADKEDASHIAGDYLKGDVDFGVEMKCTTDSLWEHRMKKSAATCVVTLLIFSAFLFKVSSAPDGSANKLIPQLGIRNTSTVMPALKTTNKEEFKKEWEEKTKELKAKSQK